MSTHFPFTISDDEASLIRDALNAKLTVANNLSIGVRSRDIRADHALRASATAALLVRLDAEITLRKELAR